MRCAVLVSLSYLMAGSMPAGARTEVSFVHPNNLPMPRCRVAMD